MVWSFPKFPVSDYFKWKRNQKICEKCQLNALLQLCKDLGVCRISPGLITLVRALVNFVLK